MKQNHSAADKKLYSLWVEMDNYMFLAHLSGDRWTMALIVNRLIQDAREKGDKFIETLMKTP